MKFRIPLFFLLSIGAYLYLPISIVPPELQHLTLSGIVALLVALCFGDDTTTGSRLAILLAATALFLYSLYVAFPHANNYREWQLEKASDYLVYACTLAFITVAERRSVEAWGLSLTLSLLVVGYFLRDDLVPLAIIIPLIYVVFWMVTKITKRRQSTRRAYLLSTLMTAHTISFELGND